MNASRTASERPSSSVNRSLDQSQEAPNRLIWLLIRPPYSFFHAHVLSSNFSLPRPSRVNPSLSKARSTTSCVAIPAWSEPGSHRVGRPRMRATRAMTSCRVTNMACPMCSAPVTFGGGIAMQNGSPVAFGSGWKHPRDSHQSYSRVSVSPCSKFLGKLAWFAPGTTVLLSTLGPAAVEEDAPQRTPNTCLVTGRRGAVRNAFAARAVRVASAAGLSASIGDWITRI
mmetsp:Transcript_8051/g.30171  ORF Transcript_8051/g.30171 Transcript_8051/m.30171 type:complete len:227 (+) Transcript_8051:2536-3216(+)